MPPDHQVRNPDQLQLSDDARFMLGEINATVKHTSGAVADLRIEMMANLSGFNSRLQEIERSNAHTIGVRTTAIWLVTIVASFIASTFSGILTYFLGRH